MSLIKQLIAEGKKNMKTATNNLAAKHSVNKSGAGAHVPKKGEKAPRNRQKRNWKNDARTEI